MYDMERYDEFKSGTKYIPIIAQLILHGQVKMFPRKQNNSPAAIATSAPAEAAASSAASSVAPAETAASAPTSGRPAAPTSEATAAPASW